MCERIVPFSYECPDRQYQLDSTYYGCRMNAPIRYRFTLIKASGHHADESGNNDTRERQRPREKPQTTSATLKNVARTMLRKCIVPTQLAFRLNVV